MNAAAHVLTLLIRMFGASALVLGLAFWLGYARSLILLHMAFGMGLVLSLLAASWIAWMKTGRGGLATCAAGWGILIWAFGIMQSQILPGPLHWIVELAHLIAGGIAIGVGGRLATAVSQRRVSLGAP